MLKSIQGIFRDGRVELLEPAPQFESGRVLVTFLEPGTSVSLAARGIDEAQAADLLSRLKAVASDWNARGMEIYDE